MKNEYCISEYFPSYLRDSLLVEEPNQGKDSFKFQIRLQETEPVFKGHYPHFAIFPGVLLLEILEQAIKIYADQKWGIPVRLKQIKRISFKEPTFPGDILELSASKISHENGILLAKLDINRSHAGKGNNSDSICVAND